MGWLLEIAKRGGTEAGTVSAKDGGELAGRIARDPGADSRKAMALAFLDAHPEVRRACFYHAPKVGAFVILTVAVRDPRAAVEMSIARERFDAMGLFDLSLKHPGTSVFVPEH